MPNLFSGRVSPNPPHLLRWALLASLSGILLTLLLFLRPGPYTVLLFMIGAQPLLVAGFGFFVVQVYRDLRAGKVL